MLEHQDREMRVMMDALLLDCGRLFYSDVPLVEVAASYRSVTRLVDDPTQWRSGSDFERISLQCVDALRDGVGELDEGRLDGADLDFESRVQSVFALRPAVVVFGGRDARAISRFILWNVANSALEGVRTPYLAARAIANLAVHDPPDAFDLIAQMEGLAVEYEDHEEGRSVTEASIVAALTDHRHPPSAT